MRVLFRRNAYLISIISKLIIVVLSFVGSIFVNRYLGPDLKGQYSYILNYVGIISLLLNLGIGQSYTFFLRSIGKQVKQDFINIYYFQLLIYIFIIVLINLFYRNNVLNIILVVSTIAQFDSQIGFMALVNDVNKKNVINIFTTFFYTLLLCIIYIFSSKNLNYIIIAYILKLLFDIIFIIAQNSIRPTNLFINLKLLKKVFKFSFFPLVTTILITFNYSIDIIILKKFVSYSQIGIYSVGVLLAGMLWIIPDAFKDVLFNKTAQNDSIDDIKFAIKFNVYLCIIIITGFVFLGKTFIVAFYGKEYIGAYSVTLLLFLGCIPMILFKMINTLYISIGKQLFAFYILILAVSANVVSNFLLIPKMGIKGAALSSIVSYFVCGIVFLISFIKRYNIKIKDIVFFNSEEISKIKKLIKVG